MRGIRALILAASLLAFSFSASAQPPGFNIAGQVVRHLDNQPLRGARVSIFIPEQPDRRVFCTTGENGQFQFTGVPAGKYSLEVKYHGFTRLYKQLDEYSTAIAVGPGLDSEHIVFPLESPATIIGSVLDDSGDPVRGAAVYLIGQSIVRGSLQTNVINSPITGSDGSFSMSHISAGTYYVAVSARPWYAQNAAGMECFGGGGGCHPIPDPPELDVAFPITYYSNATTADNATPIKLEEGDRTQMQFNLQPVSALHVTFDTPNKQPNQHIFGSAAGTGPGGTQIPVQAQINELGLWGVAPGTYLLSFNMVFPSQTVTITGNSTLALNQGNKTSVVGKVSFDGGIPQGVAVALQSVGDSLTRTSLGSIARDGSFEIPNVEAGRYTLSLTNTNELYLKTVRAKGGDYSNGALDVAAGAQIELNLAAGRGLARVGGVAVCDKHPFAGAMILLIPKDSNQAGLIPRDQSDSDGTFTLNFTPPGRYTLIAIDNGRDLEYANPDVIAPYLEAGQVIDVPLPRNTTVEVEVQTRK